MSEFLTLEKSHPDFEKYLSGAFSKEKRALPVQSLNVRKDNEQVTFEIVSVKELKTPFFLIKWLSLMKAKNFILAAFPMFAVVMKLEEANQFSDPITGALSTIGAFLLLAAMNLRNDYNDHMQGLDRIFANSGSRSIQKGWVTAIQVRLLSNYLLAIGFLFGLPALFRYPLVMTIVGLLTVLVLMTINSVQVGMKYRRWTELAVFLLFGPILTVGYQISCGGEIEEEIVFLGIVTGWFSVFTLHLKNFQQLMQNSQAQFDNTVAFLGFEKGKKFLVLWWLIFLILFNVYHFSFTSLYWAWILCAASSLISLPFIGSTLSLESPLGSGMERVFSLGRVMYLFILSLWFLENAFYLISAEFAF